MFSLSIFNSACLPPAPAEKKVVVPRPEFIDLADRIHIRQFEPPRSEWRHATLISSPWLWFHAGCCTELFLYILQL